MLAGLATAFTLALAPSVASAQSYETAPPDEFDNVPSNSGLTESGGDDIGTRVVEFSPAGCAGTTNNPHRSSHVKYTVNVTGNTKCEAVVGLTVNIRIERSRWYGWEERGSNTKSVNGTMYLSTNAASPYCKGDTHDWRGITKHTSVEAKGTYTATTKNQQDGITC